MSILHFLPLFGLMLRNFLWQGEIDSVLCGTDTIVITVIYLTIVIYLGSVFSIIRIFRNTTQLKQEFNIGISAWDISFFGQEFPVWTLYKGF